MAGVAGVDVRERGRRGQRAGQGQGRAARWGRGEREGPREVGWRGREGGRQAAPGGRAAGTAHLEVVVLPLLLCLEVEAGEAAQVLAAHRLVHGGAPPDALAVVVRHVGPPAKRKRRQQRRFKSGGMLILWGVGCGGWGGGGAAADALAVAVRHVGPPTKRTRARTKRA